MASAIPPDATPSYGINNRPPSPTELSYSHLVQLAPTFNSQNHNDSRFHRDRNSSGKNGYLASKKTAPSASEMARIAACQSIQGTSSDDTTKHVDDASNNASVCNSSKNGGLGRTRTVTPSEMNFETPKPLFFNDPPNSHPPHVINLHQDQQQKQQPFLSNCQQNGLDVNIRPVDFNENMGGTAVTESERSTPMEQRLENLSLRLQAMEGDGPLTNATHLPTLPNSGPSLGQIERPPPNSNLPSKVSHPSASVSKSQRLHEIHQFIDTLKNMQHVVSRTADEQQRLKKSRALNALLTMFESIIDERRDNENPSFKNSMQHFEQRERMLQSQNEELRFLCQQKDLQLQELDNDLHRSRNEISRLHGENEQLKKDLAFVQEQCEEEQQRARDAEMVASESESVRDGLLSNYGRLTEENLELERAVEEMKSEKNSLMREIDYRQGDLSQLRVECENLNQKLQNKDIDMVNLQTKLDDANSKLAKHQQSLQVANADRQRLQDELRASHRHANSTSEQFVQLRDRFTNLQREFDFERRKNEQSMNLGEQQQQAHLEEMLKKHQLGGAAAQEQIKKLARANAELKTKLNELNARLNYTQQIPSEPKVGSACREGTDCSPVGSECSHFSNTNCKSKGDLNGNKS